MLRGSQTVVVCQRAEMSQLGYVTTFALSLNLVFPDSPIYFNRDTNDSLITDLKMVVHRELNRVDIPKN